MSIDSINRPRMGQRFSSLMYALRFVASVTRISRSSIKSTDRRGPVFSPRHSGPRREKIAQLRAEKNRFHLRASTAAPPTFPVAYHAVFQVFAALPPSKSRNSKPNTANAIPNATLMRSLPKICSAKSSTLLVNPANWANRSVYTRRQLAYAMSYSLLHRFCSGFDSGEELVPFVVFARGSGPPSRKCLIEQP
jgi:hypothetical protein